MEKSIRPSRQLIFMIVSLVSAPALITPGYKLDRSAYLRERVLWVMTLDDFPNRHSRRKWPMANCAHLINCLNSCIWAPNRFCVTPVGHVLPMYAAHQGGHAVRTMFARPRSVMTGWKAAAFGGLAGLGFAFTTRTSF